MNFDGGDNPAVIKKIFISQLKILEKLLLLVD